MTMPPILKLSALALLLTLTSSCRSTGDAELNRLPYHVALVPLTPSNSSNSLAHAVP